MEQLAAMGEQGFAVRFPPAWSARCRRMGREKTFDHSAVRRGGSALWPKA